MSTPCDVLGLGCVAVDDLLYVESFPPPDTKTRIRRRSRYCGGLTATALVAAARLGARCAYAGALGDDELSRFVLETFAREGIDTAARVFHPEARPVASMIVVDEQTGTRNIFFDLNGSQGAADDAPSAEVVCACRVLLVDHFGVPGMVRAARLARAAGIPVVADLERDDVAGFGDLLALVDHLIVSAEFAQRLTGRGDPAAALPALRGPGRAVVAITVGEQGCYYALADGVTRHQPAFPVTPVDTTGCGDVFHGAYASALAHGLAIRGCIRFAAAAAALKATQPGGQAGIPNRATVEALLTSAADCVG